MKLVSIYSTVESMATAVALFSGFVNFFLRSVTYFKLAKLRGVKASYCAFVPFFQYYVVGRICDDIVVSNGKKRTDYRVILTFLGVGFCIPSFVSCFFSNISLFTFNVIDLKLKFINYMLLILEISFIICYLVCFRTIFEKYRSFNFSGRVLFFICSISIAVGMDFVASVILLSFLIGKSKII